MSTNGFKSPAPVLPAMGLHSFHNDSPPFAASAPITEHPDPSPLALDAPQQSQQSNTNGRPTLLHRASSPSSRTPKQRSSPPPIPASSPPKADVPPPAAPSAMPIPVRGFAPTLLKDRTRRDSRGGSSSSLQEADDELSSSRSRRLVSGYLFGNPPFPVGGRSATLATENSGDRIPSPENGQGGNKDRDQEEDDRERHSDSPPLSLPPTNSSSPTHTPQTTLQTLESLSMADASPEDLRRRKSMRSRERDRETGYDALNGLNDGEADLDESAPQAAFGTMGYLRGEGGGEGRYRFPMHRLRTSMKDESKIPVVIVACGSFSPPTYLHLRMFEMAKDEILESQTFEIMGGYYSPVSSHYKKSGLAPAIHRVRMCELAVEHTSTWLMVDPWEAGQPEYQRTAVVLDHFDEMLNGGEEGEGGLLMSDGQRRRFKIMLLAGGDLIESFGEPGVWSEPDLHIILGRFGCLIVERAGSDVWAFLLSHDILYHHRRNVIVIKQLIYNDISSTKVRLFVRRGMSIKYLLPNSVIQYIYDHKLYREPDARFIKS